MRAPEPAEGGRSTPELESRRSALLERAAATPGFLVEPEALALHRLGLEAASSGLGALLEIGSYLGRSTLYLAAACLGTPTVLFSLDHHHGSEEMQAGWPAHDPSLVDGATGRMDSLSRWRGAIVSAGAEEFVVGVVGTSAQLARYWGSPLALLFIDGGHAEECCRADLEGVAHHLAPRALLALHDVFPEGRGGGGAPWRVYREALSSGSFRAEESLGFGSLAVLRRNGANNSAVAVPPANRSRANTTAAAE